MTDGSDWNEAPQVTSGRVSVIFIGGFGRSGSTVVDRLLGSQEGVASLGELTFLWDRGVHQNQLCGCGEAFAACAFWKQVMEYYHGEATPSSPADMERLRRWLEKPWFVPALIVPKLVPRGFARARERYLSGLRNLYTAVSRASGAKYLVDSSKEPRHGLLLAATPGIDLHVIHLVRDSRAVAFSWGAPKRRPEIQGAATDMPRYARVRSALEWNIRNWLTARLRSRAKTYHLARYEAVVASPEAALGPILARIGIPAPFELKRDDDGLVDIGSAHTLSGNPVRFQAGGVRLAVDDRWTTQMSGRDKWIVSLLTCWGLARHGYPVTPARASRAPHGGP